MSLLTGPNGSNKSTVLRAVVDAFVAADTAEELLANESFDYVPGIDRNVRVGGGSRQFPSKVIAISGTVSDRFPPKRGVGGVAGAYQTDKYVYFGQRADNFVVSRKLSSATLAIGLLGSVARESFRAMFTPNMFSLTRTAPRIRLRVRRKSRYQLPSGILQAVRLQETLTTASQRPEGSRPSRDYAPIFATQLLERFSAEVMDEVDRFTDSPRPAADIDIVITRQGSSVKVPTNLSREAVMLGLLSGKVEISRFEIASDQGAFIGIDDLSSGEYHFLASLLTVWTAVDDESVILVDEPENSLHPQWQQLYMESLLNAASSTRGTHLIIATHSPLIVAAAPMENSYSVDLSPFQSGNTNDVVATDSDSFAKSADEVLIDHFGLASSRNFFVVETLQRAVDMYADEERDPEQYRQIQAEISAFEGAIGESDPLRELVDTLLGKN
ncbi:ATP-binding protein [Caballeronia sordidicola]|nr:ATP-binding protein [Caballeronia sordidicola]